MTDADKELIYQLAQKLTGAHPEGTYQIGIFLTNIKRRMQESGCEDLSSYLELVKTDSTEHSHLVSALSIHTTSWFRENPHYVILQKILLNRTETTPFSMWSCATSTGEEVYSFALLFEEFRRFHSTFNYHVLGTDIDPISLESARRAIYDQKNLNGPVSYYKKHIRIGSGKTEGLFTFSSEIRQRCQFKLHDIREHLTTQNSFDLIVCRNVLIYFPANQVREIITYLIQCLRPDGHLILGHSEMIDHQSYNLVLRGHAVYQKVSHRTQIAESTVTKHISTSSIHTNLELEEKNSLLNMSAPSQRATRPYVSPSLLSNPQQNFDPQLILIGASTGGPQALAEVLWSLPLDSPPVLVAQHISAKFGSSFILRLAEVTGLKVGSNDDQSMLLRGHIYCAQAENHLGVQLIGSHFQRFNSDQPAINGHRPSVDFLFESALPFAKNCIAIILSGMGRDGANGIKKLHDAGAYTFAQSEQDCIVYGMPKEAILKNAVDFIGTSEQIHEKLFTLTRRRDPLNT